MSSPFNAGHWRLFVLLALMAVFAATVGGFLLRKWQGAADNHSLPPRISADVDQQTHSFSLSKTLEDHTIYTIQAEQVTSFKDSGKALLHGVTILIYGKDGTRHDRITTAECEYDATSGTVHIPGQVEMLFDLPLAPGASSTEEGDSGSPVSITTSKMVFDQGTGNAATAEPVQFRFKEGTGTSVGADYDRGAALVRLTSNADFLLHPQNVGGQPTRIQAGAAAFHREEGKVLLENAVAVTQGTRRLQAQRAEVSMDDDYHVQQVQLEGDVVATDETSEARTDIRASHGLALFAPEGAITSLNLSEAVKWNSRSLTQEQYREGESEQMLFTFYGADSKLLRVEATNAVRVVLRRSGAGSTDSGPRSRSMQTGLGAGAQTISGERMEIEMGPDGQRAREAHVQGSPRLELSSTGPGSERRIVTGDVFDLAFDSAGRLRQFESAKNSRVVVENPTQDGSQRVATSDLLVATFDPATNSLERLRQEGNFQYRDSQRQARAAQAEYALRADVITLQGEPATWNSEGRITADVLKLHAADNALDAEGRVASTLFPSPSKSVPAPGPVHVIANRLHYSATDQRAQYEGGVRLWRGTESFLQSDRLEFGRRDSQLIARDHVYSVFREAPQGGSNPSAKGTGAPRPSPPGKGGAKTFVVRADTLVYGQREQKALYTGSVKMQTDAGLLNSSELEITFQPSSTDASAEFSMAQGSIQRAEARGAVTLTQEGRSAKADRAEYVPEQEEIHLFGAPASVFDPRHGTTEGARLTYHIGDDTIFVEGEPGLPTETRWKIHP